MTILKQKLEHILAEKFPGAETKIIDLAGDDNHYALEIKHDSFIGKSKIAQHKMVNDALRGFIGEQLHALSIKTIY